MLCVSAWDHFRETSTSEVFYSMAPRLCGATLATLEDTLMPHHAVPQPVMQAILDKGVSDLALQDMPVDNTPLALQFQHDDGNSCVPVDSAAAVAEVAGGDIQGVAVADFKDVFFFRLLAGSLHRRKRARTDPGLGMDASQVVIQHHKIREVCWDQKEVLVYLDAAASSTESSNNLLSHPESLKSLTRWEMLSTQHVLKHRSLPAQAEAVLDRLCKCQGQITVPFEQRFPDSAFNQQTEGLQILQSRGYIRKCHEDDEFRVWELEDHVKSQMCLVVRLGKPQDFATPRSEQTHAAKTEAKNMTVMELMLSLQSEGFSFQFWSGPGDSCDEPQPFNLHRRMPKVMFLKGGAAEFSRFYLLALAEPSLKQNGVSVVRHCQPEKYYIELLAPIIGVRQKSKRKANQAALTFQVDAGIALPAQSEASEVVARRVRGKQSERLAIAAAPATDDPTPQPLVPLAPDAKAKPMPKPASKKKQQHEKSHRWGAGFLTFKPPSSWQATCHRKGAHCHALGKATRCTRTRSFVRPEEEIQVLRQLRYWLNSASEYSTRVAHMNAEPASAALLASPGFDSSLERNRVRDDYNSEAEAEPEGSRMGAEASGHRSPAPRATSSRGGDEAASDPPSNSSSSSSSSDSSSSSESSSSSSGS